MKPQIYIAGPMRGLPYFNFPAFDTARNALIAAGFEVCSPADLDRHEGFDALAMPADSDWSEFPETDLNFQAVVMRDLQALSGCQGILMLDGWQRSRGSRAEKAVAEWLGLYYVRHCTDGTFVATSTRPEDAGWGLAQAIPKKFSN